MTSSNDAKATMKAVRIHAFGGPEELRYEDAPRPKPKAGEVLIRIHASAVGEGVVGASPRAGGVRGHRPEVIERVAGEVNDRR